MQKVSVDFTANSHGPIKIVDKRPLRVFANKVSVLALIKFAPGETRPGRIFNFSRPTPSPNNLRY